MEPNWNDVIVFEPISPPMVAYLVDGNLLMGFELEEHFKGIVEVEDGYRINLQLTYGHRVIRKYSLLCDSLKYVKGSIEDLFPLCKNKQAKREFLLRGSKIQIESRPPNSIIGG